MERITVRSTAFARIVRLHRQRYRVAHNRALPRLLPIPL